MQAPDEPFAKFPGTCKSQAPARTKSSCGFGALNPCSAAPLAHPPFSKWISASTYHQQAQSRLGSTLHSHLLSSYIQILPTTWSALGPPSQQSIHRAHSSLQGEKPQIRVGEHLQEEERMDEGVGRRGGKEITFTARERSLS